MLTIHHIFIYVVDRKDDPFSGIKEQLVINAKTSKTSVHRWTDVRCSVENYSTINKVEYSIRKYFRFIYYKKVFEEIANCLTQEIQNCSNESIIVVYLSDESVWALWLNEFYKKCVRKFYKVNVQHGVFHLSRPSSLMARNIFNIISKLIWGYPLYGLGYGSGFFDIYLTYSSDEANFIKMYTNADAYSCPKLIKQQLYKHYDRSIADSLPIKENFKHILFPLPPEVYGSTIKCNLRGVFQEILPIARLLIEKHDMKMLLRFHPGTDLNYGLKILSSCDLKKYADVDNNDDIAVSISKCYAVIGYNSTALFEASLLGKVPISILGKCFRGICPFPHELVEMDLDYESMLDKALSRETRDKYIKESTRVEFNWINVLTQLISSDNLRYK